MPKNPQKNQDFLGSGWKFPLYVGQEVTLSHRDDSIAESIRIIISTAKGERVMRPEFGCDLQKMVFAINNKANRIKMAAEVRQALVRWEPRIKVQKVTATTDQQERNRVNITVEYTVISSNIRRNLVYPFYL